VKLEVLTPDKSLYSGNIKIIKVPGSDGSFEVLNNHAPLISTLEKGTIIITSMDGKTSKIEIAGGVIEVKKNEVIVLADIV
jgi:F-type H+-transporting ATPase subunit epsilon